MFMGGQYGMHTLQQPMVALLKEGNVIVEECFARSPDRGTLGKIMKLEDIPFRKDLKLSSPLAGPAQKPS